MKNTHEKLTRFKKLLDEFKRHSRSELDVNIFSIGGRGYYENPTSDLLAFFVDPARKHGLSDLVLSCLVDCLPSGRRPNGGLEEAPVREFSTEKGNRIDLVLKGFDWVMAIENKIRHTPINDFKEYKNTINSKYSRIPSELRFFVILSVDDPRQQDPDWIWISYKLLIDKIKNNLGVHFIASGPTRWNILLREFVINLEDNISKPMNSESVSFVSEHYPDIVGIIELKKKYIGHIKSIIGDALTKEDQTENPPAVAVNNWDCGTVFIIYPRKNRKDKVVMLLDDATGNFRVQFYYFGKKRSEKNYSATGFYKWGDYGSLFLGSEPNPSDKVTMTLTDGVKKLMQALIVLRQWISSESS